MLAAVAIPIAIQGSFVTLALLSATARLTTYLFTCAAVPRLRKISKEQGFRAPGGLVVPILGTLISLTLFSIMTRERLIAAIIALTVGAVLFAIARAAGRPPREPIAQ